MDFMLTCVDWLSGGSYEALHESPNLSVSTKNKGKIMKDEWKEVVGFEDYFLVSNTGKIWSKRTNKEIKFVLGKTGYLCFTTRLNGRNSQSICLKVHRLVATAFVENFGRKPFVNHIDGNKQNNYATNLEWCTSKENYNHAINIGLFDPKGENNNSSKLTEQDVLEIVTLLKNKNIKQRTIAKKYNVGEACIRDIKFGRNWSWLTGIIKK